MAKTFDLGDPAQKAAYLEESVFQWVMYGENWLTLNKDGTLTVWDPDEVPPVRVTVVP